jgi:sensor histidine kinase YesM
MLLGLKDGNYLFEIQARLGNQSWSDIKKLRFIISPPFWQEVWFILLMLVLITLLITALMRYRIHQIHENNKRTIKHLEAEQKAIQAKLDPHFVFNIISSAQYLILKESKEKASRFLHLFSKQLRNVLDLSNKHFNILNDEIKMLHDYIELERFRLGESFEYNISVTKDINADQEKILSLAIQPFIENAIQHGLRNRKSGGELLIEFEIDKTHLKITIADNGIGRKAAKALRTAEKNKKQSHGINISKERLVLHNKGIHPSPIVFQDFEKERDGKSGTTVIIYMKRI